MKQIVLFVLTVLLCTVASHAGTLQYNANFDGSSNIELCVESNGLFAYASTSEYWSEAYVGPTFQLGENAGGGVGTGIESNQNSLRFGGFLWAAHGPLSATYFIEDGGSGHWHRIIIENQVTDNTKLGVLEETGNGVGLSAEHQLNTTYTVQIRAFPDGKGRVALLVAL